MQLTDEEKKIARYCGKNRQETSRKLNKVDRLVARMSDKEKIDNEIYAVMAEIFISKLFNLPWVAENYLTDRVLTDVGTDIEVKTSKYKNAHLIIRPRWYAKDKTGHIETHKFVLVTYDRKTEELTYCGWIEGKEAMSDKYWRGDSWWVPQDKLCKEIINGL